MHLLAAQLWCLMRKKSYLCLFSDGQRIFLCYPHLPFPTCSLTMTSTWLSFSHSLFWHYLILKVYFFMPDCSTCCAVSAFTDVDQRVSSLVQGLDLKRRPQHWRNNPLIKLLTLWCRYPVHEVSIVWKNEKFFKNALHDNK